MICDILDRFCGERVCAREFGLEVCREFFGRFLDFVWWYE